MNEIKNQFDGAKSLFTTQSSTNNLPHGSYSSSCTSFHAFGHGFSLDLTVLSVFSPLVYFIFSVYFMILNFNFLVHHLLKGVE